MGELRVIFTFSRNNHHIEMLQKVNCQMTDFSLDHFVFFFLRCFFLSWLDRWCHFVSKIYGNVCESGYLNELITISSENEHNSMKN